MARAYFPHSALRTRQRRTQVPITLLSWGPHSLAALPVVRVRLTLHLKTGLGRWGGSAPLGGLRSGLQPSPHPLPLFLDQQRPSPLSPVANTEFTGRSRFTWARILSQLAGIGTSRFQEAQVLPISRPAAGPGVRPGQPQAPGASD